MSLEISLVPYGHLTAHIGAVIGAGYLATAAELTCGRCTVDDLVRLCYTGQYSLWVIFDPAEAKLVGFFFMELKQYPCRRMMCIQHCVTERNTMDEGFDAAMQDVMARYAKDNGCDGIEFVGRLGWKKYVSALGYTCTSAVYQTFFDGVQK